ncbi:fused response regulator/phosphatase [Rhodococcus sp. Z13]|uniref:Fused response regulator/phosphatase n=1 Tax=Rhodococcus sacchari TaxID=2962047 RepID=A0ACD4DK36_9NOCA|nr:fused response regulator/phosphatase [Rhodococcus sp. Z13]UYP20382.1 fused response regulator/phosphatase [Rhodococcus sp. Z13]
MDVDRGQNEPGGPPSLLLVEDDPGDALIVEELVVDSAPEMTVVWVQTLARAREELVRNVPDCVLLDLHLPDASGLEAVARVQEIADSVPIVVLTGLAEERTGLEALSVGAQDYLVKGRVEPDLFGRAVRYAIQRKHAEIAAAELQASRLHAQENARLERGLLPSPLLRDGQDFAVVSRYRPGRASALLGGDFYDVVQTDDGTVHVLIGDVSGHGPDEAALGVALRIAWRTLVLSGVTGPQRLHRLEEILVAERTESRYFASMTNLCMPPDRRTVEVMRAGHPGLLLRHAGTVEWVEAPGGPALGLLPGVANWPVHEMELPEAGSIVLFTDGLFEGHRGPGPERLGEEGLLELARERAHLPPAEFTDALIDAAERLADSRGGLSDDVAVVHVQWNRK